MALSALYSCNKGPSNAKYELQPAQALKTGIIDKDVIAPEVLATLIYDYKDGAPYQFVDLRSPGEYDDGHIAGAINIPLGKLMNTENCNTLMDAKKINIIYGAKRDQVIIASSLLKQVGFNNFYVSKGDYDYIKNNILDSYSIYAQPYDKGKALYDYAKVVAETAGAATGAAKSSAAKPAAPIKRKKKEAAGGGCD